VATGDALDIEQPESLFACLLLAIEAEMGLESVG
jgi:hypothetical protein